MEPAELTLTEVTLAVLKDLDDCGVPTLSCVVDGQHASFYKTHIDKRDAVSINLSRNAEIENLDEAVHNPPHDFGWLGMTMIPDPFESGTCFVFLRLEVSPEQYLYRVAELDIPKVVDAVRHLIAEREQITTP